MQDHHFESHSDKPHYYVFSKQNDTLRHQDDSAFYHYDTIEEAAALFQYLQIELPHLAVSLGIHQDGEKRADIVERINGATVLSDDFKHISPWKDSPAIATTAEMIAERLGAEWRIDRELLAQPVLVPNVKPKSLYRFFEDKTLCPEDSQCLHSCIEEVYVVGKGWMPIDVFNSKVKSHELNAPALMVDNLQVRYELMKNGFRGSSTISPHDFKLMEARYLELQANREQDADAPSLGTLKQEAAERAKEKNQARFATPNSKRDEINAQR